MTKTVDLAVIGGGIHGASIALFAARGGMNVTLIDRDALARGASGTNAGTLTMQMTRAALIPYALKAHEMWVRAPEWLGHDVGVKACDGLSLAFTEAEETLLAERAEARRAAGAPIRLVTPEEARAIEPSVSTQIRMASHCTIDGFANAYLTGVAFRRALISEGVELQEYTSVDAVEPAARGYSVHTKAGVINARQIVLAGGVWLEPMLRWLSVHVPIRTLVNQLAVTERMPPVMRTVVGIASGLLSLKQYPHGTVVIGGGWQGIGDRTRNTHSVVHDSLIGNVRLAVHAIPGLAASRIVRSWTGFEAETADALPAVGAVPGHEGAWVCGSVHSGYTSGPYIARCLSQAILGEEPEMPLFPIDRLLPAVVSNPLK
ncbi:NAD(P)/FAD-dependent oxidoreductase [Roseinatronobacter bogoriensis]|uniref:FAD-binding oxidoreductase n=1 Tax=Roseinatronobacter bogoriensis subsp. barguzinensis TaxID=441209 RepID=A0A2K8K6G9_9RHOB|nr:MULTISPECIES: FAD-binding oxidoreductase [Rhodobaca]ATX64526.1 FAD-binding oxidoreductase [Rhodobaca barguzinensis]MBB4209241.1 glycine/D-amino acid oxidase-like deaminating enzyme [Rhodobaca bogoriensis DSM 18756]TDW36233.1 glycine/D-amino acid oxidase-like deaminating enzyme [Rhodobaca barguzinensis]TDY67639.1 glycine/D-amino acid oxidase-like deaminating enzyme [Rhodobaca bogoriensis DSM 18756]